jgi:hypothetical protein
MFEGMCMKPRSRATLGIADHTAAHDANLAVYLFSRLDDLLDAVNIAGETGHDDALFGFGKNAVEFLTHHFFRQGITFALHVGGVRHHHQNTLAAVIRETVQVDGNAVNGSGVNLEIARVDHHARGSGNGQTAGVHDAMGNPDKLDMKGPRSKATLRVNFDEGRWSSAKKILLIWPSQNPGSVWCHRWARLVFGADKAIAPIWSSWPWVRRTPLSRPAFSARKLKSGMM